MKSKKNINKKNNNKTKKNYKTNNYIKRIISKKIIPGKGNPINNGTLIIKSGVIEYCGLTKNSPKSYKNEKILHIPFIMPGLWDSHVHFLGDTSRKKIDWKKDLYYEDKGILIARCVYVTKYLDPGFTSVREVGGLGLHLTKLINEKVIRGPNIYSVGQMITTTGGW